jgi:hypothetical protein
MTTGHAGENICNRNVPLTIRHMVSTTEDGVVEIEVEMFHLNTTPPIKDHNAKSVENLVTPSFNGITGSIMPTKAPLLLWRLI